MNNQATLGIAFDLEGTVVDLEKFHWQGHILAAEKAGVKIGDFDEMFRVLPHSIGGPDRRVAEEIFELSDKNLSVKDIEDFDVAGYRESLFAIPEIQPRPGFLDIFHKLEHMGLGLAIGSLTREDEANFILKKAGLTKIFRPANIILHSHVKELKPHPEVFLLTAERMGIPSKQQLVFEDSPRGVQAAIAAESRAVGMPVNYKGETVAKLVDAGAMPIFTSWKQIGIENLLKSFEGES